MSKVAKPTPAETHRTIHVRGAREHNLKNVDLEIPRDALIVFTGLSGSGKSSLAFDTIYAEGQRRYVESLSAYARQFLEMMQKPDVDHIDGLSPAISIEQKTTSKNPRSTVGTVTEIYDYLRLLFARVGVPYSPATGLPIESQTVTQMVDRVLTLPEGTRLYLLAPIVRGRKGEYRKELAELQKKGFQRVKINGSFYEIDDAPKLDKKFKHDIDVVVDRIVVEAQDIGRAPRRQLRDGARAGRRHRHRRVRRQAAEAVSDPPGLTPWHSALVRTTAHRPRLPKVSDPEGLTPGPTSSSNKNETHERITFSARFACPVSGFTIDEIEPRLFSFNAPAGACPKCDGLGTEMRFEADLVVPDHTLSLKKGAVYPWAKTGSTSPYYEQTLEALAKHFKVSMSTPWEKLPKKVQDAILYGTGEEEVDFVYEDGVRKYKNVKPFEGVIGNIERRWRETESDWVREELSRYQDAHPCDACGGYRLKPQALAVKIGGKHIGEVTDLSIHAANALVRRAAEDVHQEADRDRHAHPEGDPRAPAVPGRRRPRLSDAVARRRHAVGRREPAHPPRLADRLRPHRRAVRARRAVHRPAPARQRPPARDAQAPARHRQHGDRGRARRGRHPHRRLRGRHRPRRRRPRRRDRRPGHARRDHGQRRQPHRAVPHRRAPDPDAEGAPQARQRTRR